MHVAHSFDVQSRYTHVEYVFEQCNWYERRGSASDEVKHTVLHYTAATNFLYYQ
jgi:hypothetical protein